MVEAIAGCGVPHEDIGTVLGIDATTLRRHYRPEIDRAVIVANAKVAGNLFKIATGPGREAVTAAIFWLKTRAGWSEYSPPPKPSAPPRAPALGKKEAASIAASTAEDGTDWADLVPETSRRAN